MSSLLEYDDYGAGGFTDAVGNESFSYWNDWVNSVFDGSEDSDISDGYEDNNTFFKMSLSSARKKDPDDIFDKYDKDFVGMTWRPTKFFQRLYFKNILNRTAKFIDVLNSMNTKDVRRKAYIRNLLQKANISVKKAQKKYDRDQMQCLFHIVDALQAGKKIVECLKKLDSEGRLE